LKGVPKLSSVDAQGGGEGSKSRYGKGKKDFRRIDLKGRG